MTFIENSQDPSQDAAFAAGLRTVPTVLGYDVNTTTRGQLRSGGPSRPDLLPYVAGTGYTTVDNPGGWTLSQPFPLVATDSTGKQKTYLSLAGATVQQYSGRKFSAVNAWNAKYGDELIPLDGDYKILNLPFRTHEQQEQSVRVGATRNSSASRSGCRSIRS